MANRKLRVTQKDVDCFLIEERYKIGFFFETIWRPLNEGGFQINTHRVLASRSGIKYYETKSEAMDAKRKFETYPIHFY